jgi:hypothetical protein
MKLAFAFRQRSSSCAEAGVTTPPFTHIPTFALCDVRVRPEETFCVDALTTR